MTQVIAILVAFVAWSSLMYYEGYDKKTALCGKEDAQHDLAQAGVTVAAEKGVIGTIGEQQNVTQGVDNAYQAKKLYIDNQYAAGLIGMRGPASTPAGYSLPATGSAASRPNVTPTRSLLTKVYKLSAQECDENTQQLYGLQEWVRGQQTVKQATAQ